MDYKQIKKVLAPQINNQTLYQLDQIKTFVDVSIKQVISQNFENESDKIKYLLNTLNNIRDFILTQTNENSLRLRLIKEFEAIKEAELLGNASEQPVENTLQKTEESLEQDLLD